jgi:hypothetical protein
MASSVTPACSSSRRPVIDRLFSYAEDHKLVVRSLVHSHEHDAFMSKTDREGTIRVPGFVAAIIPTFHQPPADPGSWGWWAWAGGAWAESAAAETIDGAVTVVVADAHGVVVTGLASSVPGDLAGPGEVAAPASAGGSFGVPRHLWRDRLPRQLQRRQDR